MGSGEGSGLVRAGLGPEMWLRARLRAWSPRHGVNTARGFGFGFGFGVGVGREFGFGRGFRVGVGVVVGRSGEATRLVGVAAHGVPCCLGEVEVVLELGRERSQLLLLHGDACALGLTDAPRLLLESLPQDVRLQTRAQR
eukprot:scaffold39383_cov33-Phaeocystis_antarctica.AAC.1